MSDVFKAIAAIGNATASVSQEIKARSDLNNRPEMQLALVRQRMQSALDDATKAVNDENMEEIRLLLAADPGAV